jgi:hypothetical protein
MVGKLDVVFANGASRSSLLSAGCRSRRSSRHPHEPYVLFPDQSIQCARGVTEKMKVAFEIRGPVDEPYLKVHREHVLAMTLRPGSMEMCQRRSKTRPLGRSKSRPVWVWKFAMWRVRPGGDGQGFAAGADAAFRKC